MERILVIKMLGISRKMAIAQDWYAVFFGGVLKSMLTLNEAIIDVKEG